MRCMSFALYQLMFIYRTQPTTQCVFAHNNSDANTLMQPGDKILKVSASFGTDIWDAINYGQVMYAIRTRNGGVFFELQSNGGDTTAMQVPSVYTSSPDATFHTVFCLFHQICP